MKISLNIWQEDSWDTSLIFRSRTQFIYK